MNMVIHSILSFYIYFESVIVIHNYAYYVVIDIHVHRYIFIYLI